MALPTLCYSVAAPLFFAGAFVGPERNAGQPPVPSADKVSALQRLNRTGDVQGCLDVLASIRAKRVEAERDLPKCFRAQQELEEGIRNQFKLMRGARNQEEVDDMQRTIESWTRSLETCRFHQKRLNYLVISRQQEEFVFTLFYEAAKAKRPKPTEP